MSASGTPDHLAYSTGFCWQRDATIIPRSLEPAVHTTLPFKMAPNSHPRHSKWRQIQIWQFISSTFHCHASITFHLNFFVLMNSICNWNEFIVIVPTIQNGAKFKCSLPFIIWNEWIVIVIEMNRSEILRLYWYVNNSYTTTMNI